MGGGLLDLAAYGAQDVYLTGNPQITFFKTVYRRHTNFSMESVKQIWVGNPNTENSRAECTLSRTGDLVSGIHFEIQFSNVSISISDYIKDVSVEIGGQIIDRQTGQFIESYGKLTNKRPPNSIFSRTTLLDRSGNNNIFSTQMTYFIPLMFWFCRHPGSALPLVALQYHDIKIILNTGSNIGTDFTSKNDIYVDYIYLDTDERRRFAEKSHEYLIEQVQYKQFSTKNTTRFDIGFLNHPVKELIWVADEKQKGFENIDNGEKQIVVVTDSKNISDTHISNQYLSEINNYYTQIYLLKDNIQNYIDFFVKDTNTINLCANQIIEGDDKLKTGDGINNFNQINTAFFHMSDSKDIYNKLWLSDINDLTNFDEGDTWRKGGGIKKQQVNALQCKRMLTLGDYNGDITLDNNIYINKFFLDIDNLPLLDDVDVPGNNDSQDDQNLESNYVLIIDNIRIDKRKYSGTWATDGRNDEGNFEINIKRNYIRTGVHHVHIENNGTGYDNGTYKNVPTTNHDESGNGTGLTLDIDVFNGSITRVLVNSVGKGYNPGDKVVPFRRGGGMDPGVGSGDFELQVSDTGYSASIYSVKFIHSSVRIYNSEYQIGTQPSAPEDYPPIFDTTKMTATIKYKGVEHSMDDHQVLFTDMINQMLEKSSLGGNSPYIKIMNDESLLNKNLSSIYDSIKEGLYENQQAPLHMKIPVTFKISDDMSQYYTKDISSRVNSGEILFYPSLHTTFKPIMNGRQLHAGTYEVTIVSNSSEYMLLRDDDKDALDKYVNNIKIDVKYSDINLYQANKDLKDGDIFGIDSNGDQVDSTYIESVDLKTVIDNEDTESSLSVYPASCRLLIIDKQIISVQVSDSNLGAGYESRSTTKYFFSNNRLNRTSSLDSHGLGNLGKKILNISLSQSQNLISNCVGTVEYSVNYTGRTIMRRNGQRKHYEKILPNIDLIESIFKKIDSQIKNYYDKVLTDDDYNYNKYKSHPLKGRYDFKYLFETDVIYGLLTYISDIEGYMDYLQQLQIFTNSLNKINSGWSMTQNEGSENIHDGFETVKENAATWKISLNGNDRISERDPGYFCRKQISDYHSGSFTTSGESDGDVKKHNSKNDIFDIAVYSFALRPEELQPSGTCNFSRIDNAELITSGPIDDYVGDSFTVYAINYNVLRVMSGMGGLAYAN